MYMTCFLKKKKKSSRCVTEVWYMSNVQFREIFVFFHFVLCLICGLGFILVYCIMLIMCRCIEAPCFFNKCPMIVNLPSVILCYFVSVSPCLALSRLVSCRPFYAFFL
ncbi:hypothetical protein GGS20DRAFT_289522 [Poronia punctata]|nr:hypothetical protein GGS20DRAFT_289522 [Poronia punctata]